MTDAITLEQLEDHGIEVLPEIIWEETEPLRPGLDIRGGITYITVPAKVNVPKTEGRGKAAVQIVVPTDMLVCITSDGRSFPYTPENIEKLGFSYPDNVVNPKVRRWSRDSITEFLRGDATPPDPTMLHAGLRKVYEDYIEFAREEYYDILPLFIMGSYVFRLFRSLGYLHFNGTAASGKSQNLRLLEALALNTQWSSSISAAALYRQLAGFPGVILVDEAEGFEGERGEELRRILNAGYLDGSTVKRAEKGKNDAFYVASFESFGPKAIASINVLDNVIGSRCLIVAMRPTLRKIAEFDKDNPRWAAIRDRLYLWAMYHAPLLEERVRLWNEELRNTRAPNLVGRQWQITQLYVILADYLDTLDQGNRCDRLILFFNEYFATLQKQQDATDRIRVVLQCLPRVLYGSAPHDGGFYFLKTIHEVVSGYLEDDSKEYYKTRTLGKHLDVLGFKNKRSRKRGVQIWLDPEAVRAEFRQRRVEPYPEDVEWLAGTVEYTHLPPPEPEDDRLSMWAGVEEQP